MKASIEVIDNVILRCFKGDVYLQDIIDSWDETLDRFDNLMDYKGIITDFSFNFVSAIAASNIFRSMFIRVMP